MLKKLKKTAALIMSAALIFGSCSLGISFENVVQAAGSRSVEALSRGLCVIQVRTGVQLSWRYLGTDTPTTAFRLYRGDTLIYTSLQDMATSYYDESGSLSDTYKLEVFKKGSESMPTETAYTEYKFSYDSKANGGYFDMILDRPAADSRTGASYTPNDCSVADLDGDKQYELIVKWYPSDAQDNSAGVTTGSTIIDAYKIEPGTAKKLWRIDLGQNIRSGAHYTQFMVYDFDCDGKAEMACKTAPGSLDGKGSYVNTASSVSAIKNDSHNTTSYVNSDGMILSGNEYLTLFDGETGAALDTIYYEPGRGTVSDWGDSYGNRVDRFLGAVAYLNGTSPSLVMCRGYYTRATLAAYNIVNKKFVKQWFFDSDSSGNSAYAGQGNHNLAAADVDNDGCDEIVYGSATIDHNGKGLYSTGLGHGDAIHVGDLIPSRTGLEVFQVHEESKCATLRDAKTGEILQRWNGTGDVGRGVADNFIAGNKSAEFTSVADNIVYDSDGKSVCEWSDVAKWGMNSLIYWDDDLERELLDRTMIEKYGVIRLLTGQNVSYNNGSKSNVCITADIMGDWREEMVAPLSDASGVRIYITPYDTNYRIYTLMHNTQYRCGVAAENVAYNQPPHVDYWLGTGDALPSLPNVYAVGEIPAADIKAEFIGDNLSLNEYEADTAVCGNKFKIIASSDAKVTTVTGDVSVGSMTIGKGARTSSKASDSAIEFTAKEAGTLYIGAISGNASSDRYLCVYNSSGTRVGLFTVKSSSNANGTAEIHTVSIPDADTYTIYSTSGPIVIYYLGSTAELKEYESNQTGGEVTTEATESTTETTTETAADIKAEFIGDNLPLNEYTADTAVCGNKFKIIASSDTKVTTVTGDVSVGSMTIGKGARTSSKTSDSAIEFTAKEAGTLYIGSISGNASSDRYLCVYNSSGTRVGLFTVKASNNANGTAEIHTVSLPGADTYTIYSTSGPIVIYYIGSTAELKEYPIKVPFENNKYSFDNLKGTLTDDSSYGGAYLSITGTAAGNGDITAALNNDGFVFIDDTDTGSTGNLILPIRCEGNYITISGSFKPVSKNNGWTLLQIWGKKSDGTNSEIVGIRTNNDNYKLRLMGDSNNLVDTGISISPGNTVEYTIAIDIPNNTASLSIGGKTLSGNIDCSSIDTEKFITAADVRKLYVGTTAINQYLFGDADSDNDIDSADAALILKYIANNNIDILDTADFDHDNKITVIDAVKLLNYCKYNE